MSQNKSNLKNHVAPRSIDTTPQKTIAQSSIHNILTYDSLVHKEKTFVSEMAPFFTLHRFEPKKTAISRKIKKVLDKITNGKELDPI